MANLTLNQKRQAAANVLRKTLKPIKKKPIENDLKFKKKFKSIDWSKWGP